MQKVCVKNATTAMEERKRRIYDPTQTSLFMQRATASTVIYPVTSSRLMSKLHLGTQGLDETLATLTQSKKKMLSLQIQVFS